MYNQGLFTGYLNPLFLYYEVERYIYDKFDHYPPDPSQVDVMVLPREREYFYESQLYKDSKDYRKMTDHFVKTYEYAIALQGNSFCPVLVITFIISIFIALNPLARELFFRHYKDKSVPSITVFVFEIFRKTPTHNHQNFSGFALGQEYREIYYLEGCVSQTVFDPKFYKFPYGQKVVNSWFDDLHHFNQEFGFFAESKLTSGSNQPTKVSSLLANVSKRSPFKDLSEFYDPFASVEENSAVVSECFFRKDSSFKNTEQRQVWLTLAVALQSRLVSSQAGFKPIEEFEWAKELLDSEKISLTNEQLQSQMFKFIQYDCKDYL